MPAGVTRILPFAAISAVLHAAVLMNAPERLEIAVTPAGDTGAVAVQLVPSGATTPDPAAQSGVAGSIPKPVHQQSRQSRPVHTATSADEATAAESPTPAVQETVEPDRAQTALAERATSETAPTDTDRKRADAGTTEKTRPSETPDSPERSEASQPVEKPERTRPTEADETGPSDADTRIAEATDRPTKPDGTEAREDGRQAGKPSGAEGPDDRAQIASRARQRVAIHFRDRFRYPRIARQRGWEGRVVLTFRLQPDGRITDVEVAESSGRSILDENARQTLIHIQRVPEIAGQLRGEALELEVPVTYRLQPA